MKTLSRLAEILEEGKAQWEAAEAVGLEVVEELAGASGPGRWAGGSGGGALGLSGRNCLALADNLGVMKACAQDGLAGAFSLIYIDPPFFSKHDYVAEIRLESSLGSSLPALRQDAYGDTWSEGMCGYLEMLAPRLYGIRQLLSDDGCFWLHLDWHAAHYAKVLADAVFGEANFVNEVIWQYKSGGASRRRFARKHDSLLFYSKTPDYYFKPQKEKSYNRDLRPYRFKGVREYEDEIGWHTLVNMKDVWQLDMVGRTSGQRTGYATQKPEALIARVMESCTRPGDLCGDFFGGSGTTAAVAESMGRRWLLCDSGRLAALSAQKRLALAGASFRTLADVAFRETRPGRFDFSLEVHDAPGLRGKRVLFKLEGYAFPDQAAPLPVAARHLEAVHEILESDPLRLVGYWSLDPDYDGKVFRPAVFRARNGSAIDSQAEFPAAHVGVVAVRVVDVFGNSSFKLGKIQK